MAEDDTDSGSGVDAPSQSAEASDLQSLGSNYKVLGYNTDANGTTYGVLGRVDSPSGYGLYTPDDAGIDGTVATSSSHRVTVDGTRALVLGSQSSGDAGEVVHGYSGNDVLDGAVGATIGGGGNSGTSITNNPNLVYDHYCTIAGGEKNRAGSDDGDPSTARLATVGGGGNNVASAERATVAGGGGNRARGVAATVGGGEANEARGKQSIVAGGTGNATSGTASTVAGGDNNTVAAPNATVGGGGGNEATGEFATVGGGQRNRALATGATIAGGGDFDDKNFVYDEYGAIGGGLGNRAGSDDGDRTTAAAATVGGGKYNTASGARATVGGGLRNAASGTGSTVAGGRKNDATAERATVGGGKLNTAGASNATVGGGVRNDADGSESTVAGGQQNKASATGATVGGGRFNAARAAHATVAGGGGDLQNPNVVYDELGTIGGGKANVVGTDDSDPTSATGATVAGGTGNTASATGATVPGGGGNDASGKYSLAAGRAAKANDHDGAFVWGDATDNPVGAQAPGEVRFQASGGFVVQSTQTVEISDGLPAGTGDDLGLDSNNQLVNTAASSARYKRAIEPLEPDPGAVLDLVPRAFEYERTGEAGVGLIAEEVAGTVPDLVVRDGDGRPDGVRYDRLGVFLVPEVRDNRERIADLEAENERLRRYNDELRERLAAVESRLDGRTDRYARPDDGTAG